MAVSSKLAGRRDQRIRAERRLGKDRRKVNVGPPPPGTERRKSERRSGRDRRTRR